ncbi:BON domain-containing protein [Paraburkholderia dinghuensis]|uniref:BON domain-containing protein n=1 Tax=Paraburkholderia dinghuensis TaxID=2305225 RepID=A0A3N6MKR0_9BURK|nr:BON domain-containing protein [Paraburkholderia dinghuensis]RQH04374.1 BON domain-containing protein [Paraburkholderia dinghuensis]
MNAIKTITLASCVLAMLASIDAHAQASEGAGMAPAAPMTQSTKAQNHALNKKVRAALVKTKGLKTENIIVKAHGDAVMLEGTVPDASQIDLAMTAAKGVPGVASVDNHLTIKEPGQ